MNFEKNRENALAALWWWHVNNTETSHAERLGRRQQYLCAVRLAKFVMPAEFSVAVIEEYNATYKCEEKAIKDGLNQREKKKKLLEFGNNAKKR